MHCLLHADAAVSTAAASSTDEKQTLHTFHDKETASRDWR
jgi:hypothetical protein